MRRGHPLLTQLDRPIAACLDYDFRFPFHVNVRFPFSLLARINTGVFVLNKTYRNEATYQALYSLLDEFPDKREKGIPWSDQGIMNRYFRKSNKSILPYIYNGRKNLFPNKVFKNGRIVGLGDVRLLHYGGTCKPFLGGLASVAPDSKHQKYSKLHELYYDYWRRMVEELGVDWVLDEELLIFP